MFKSKVSEVFLRYENDYSRLKGELVKPLLFFSNKYNVNVVWGKYVYRGFNLLE